MSESPRIDPLDHPLFGAEAIGREAGIITESEGDEFQQQLRQTFNALLKGYLPAAKMGGLWVSTLRRLRLFFAGQADPSGWKPAAPGSKKKSENLPN